MGRIGANQEGNSESTYAQINTASIVSNLSRINSDGSLWGAILKQPPAPDGRTTYDSSTGTIVVHADVATAFAAETTTNKVVIDRKDLNFLEIFDEAITTANPYVYPNSCIQSQATTMDGIATERSNRPDSYYAVYDGDASSTGRGVHFFNASEAERQRMQANPSNNIVFDAENNTWVQRRRIRHRVVMGAGNGDWLRTDSLEQNLRFGTVSFPVAQGTKDVRGTFATGAHWVGKASESISINGNVPAGVFVLRDIAINNDVAYNGECYALVLGIVDRLNQGAYHPSFNPKGTKFWNRQTLNSGGEWYTDDVGNITSTQQAFIQLSSQGGVGARQPTGFISANSAHPDDRFYDAVYASGQGGFIDNRLSAFEREQSPNVIDGLYRGEQRIPYIRVVQTTTTSGAVSASAINGISDTSGFLIGDTVSILFNNVEIISDVTITVINTNSSIEWDSSQGTFDRLPATQYTVIHANQEKTTFEGEATQTEVFGSASNINSNTDLSNGWQGLYGGAISATLSLGRKSSGTTATVQEYVSGSWTNSTKTITNSNTISVNASATIIVVNYDVLSKISNPSTNLSVANQIGNVYATSNHQIDKGAALAESVIGEILTSNASGITREAITPIKSLIEGELIRLTHATTDIVVPTNSSKAVKIAAYDVEVNGQLFLGFVANTMSHNGTNWGDTGEMFIPSGQSGTFPDSNGVTQQATVSILNKPYGWRKNNV
jgi:hypothetical protein